MFEGIEGVGKSTQLQMLSQYLEAQEVPHLCTREPGGTPLAEKIRSIFLSEETGEETMSAWTELLLVFAARAQHLEQQIYPALAEGKWVLCDRFTDASYAYQGKGRALGCDRVQALESLVQSEFRPDQVVLLDMPAEHAMRRVQERNEKQDRMDSQHIDFYRRVRKAYQERAAESPERYLIIDAQAAVETIQAQVREALFARYPTKTGINHA